MKESSEPTWLQRLVMVGGGVALAAGAAAIARRTRVQDRVKRWLGPPSDEAKALVEGEVTQLPPLFQPRTSAAARTDALWSKPGHAPANEQAVNVVMTIARGELNEALTALFPARIKLSSSDEAWLEIDALTSIKYEPGRGVMLRAAAQLNYPLPMLPDRFTIDELTVLVTPMIVEGADGLVMAFKLDIADVDVKYLPDFVDAAIGARINKLLHDKLAKIAWDFPATLDRVVNLPKRVSLLRQIALGPTRAAVEIASEGLVVRFVIPLSFRHEGLDEASRPLSSPAS